MTIAIDFDGTICTGLDFEIKNKRPNLQLIERINYLRSCGNYIKIVTARGAYNSTIQERTAKYYQSIKSYLETNKIGYDEISFNKEFADIYIDDLAVRPDEVVITKDLSSGFTDNVVTRLNNMVIKTGETIEQEYNWYSVYQHKSDLPEILNITRHSIVYKYIEVNGNLDIDLLLHKINLYRQYPRMNELRFDSYIVNICKHLDKNEHITTGLGNKLLNRLNTIKIEPTFAHGDLSIQNIIPIYYGIKFIDPLYGHDKFGSYLTDFAKLLFSVKFYDGNWSLFAEIT